MSAESAEKAVTLGIAWLDEVRPNWRELMDWDVFDMQDTTLCVLGQVFAEDSEEAFFEDDSWSSSSGFGYVEHVFNINMGQLGFDTTDPEESWHTYAELETAWRKLA